jgi:uncharacterized protein YaiI (UPF0178 family)
MLEIYIDADSCPVKPEVYRVAERYSLNVTLVANAWMRVPAEEWLTLEIVDGGFDAADDWIVEHVHPHDIVVTADILLASRCIEKGASVLGSTGKPFTEDNITESVATRALMAELREAGTITGGPAPMESCDRSRFLQEFDKLINAIKRKNKM